jgi:hypothetical protein
MVLALMPFPLGSGAQIDLLIDQSDQYINIYDVKFD